MPMSGKDMLKRFEQSGWKKIRQKGSHVVVQKERQIEVIPMHKELKKGLEIKLLKTLEKNK